MSDRAVLARRLRVQGRTCGELGSAMYAELMERAAVDIEAGGPFLDLFAGHEDDPGRSAIALRMFGAIHRFALLGDAPELAAHYPSTGGDGDVDGAWRALRAFVSTHADQLRPFFDQPPQTNEVGRSAALAPAFLAAASLCEARPMRLLEIGCSAGLNLRWDHYRYDVPGRGWGDAASPVAFPAAWFDNEWPPAPPVTVVERAGCDLSPLDPTSDDGRTTLLSYVWPDQQDRFARLRAAIDVSRAVPAQIVQADAVAWLHSQLSAPAAGRLTIVFHSIFVQYLTDDGRAALAATLAEAGRRATDDAPLAYVRLEPVVKGEGPDVRLTMWPDGAERIVASAGFHGPPVRVH